MYDDVAPPTPPLNALSPQIISKRSVSSVSCVTASSSSAPNTPLDEPISAGSAGLEEERSDHDTEEPIETIDATMADATASTGDQTTTPRFGAFMDFLRDDQPDRADSTSIGGMESTSIEVLDEEPAEQAAEGATEEGGKVLNKQLTLAVEAEAAAAARRRSSGGASDLGTPSDFPGVRLPSHAPCQEYDYANRYPLQMKDFTTKLDAKTRIGRRCYRLNLERPFDIHCEQSPLEYGDYMAPWTKDVYPATVGPTEYCPPRHLGGDPKCWRELMRWSEAAARMEKTHAVEAGVDVVEDERKVNSLDEVEAAAEGLDALQIEVSKREGNASLASGKLSPGGGTILLDEEKRGSADEIEPAVDQYGKAIGPGPTGGWRALTVAEEMGVGHLGDRTENGEFAFRNYDLSHLALNTAKPLPITGDQDIAKAGAGAGEGLMPLRTVFSMDSATSEEERLHPKTPEQMADDTARLFRRSEISLRERADRDAEEEAEKEEARRKEELERIERERADSLSSSARVRSGSSGSAGPDRLSKSERPSRKGHGRRFSSGGKKLLRGLSSGLSRAMSDMNSTPSDSSANWRGASQRRSGSESSGRRPGMTKRSSMQALTIDKARDLVDESDGESDDGLGPEEGEESDKKPLNVSLFILGEFDTLNDLVNDGAKRLRDNRESSDLNLLLQNEPCPPPDRWVRSTGWGKCNPSSLYAAIPPKEFDWERYYDKLRAKTGKKAPAPTPQDKSAAHKDSTATQTTASTAAVSTSVSGEQPPPPPQTKAPKASKAPNLSPISSPGVAPVKTIKTAPTDKSTPKSTPKAATGPSPADSLSQSARTPRYRSGSSATGKADVLSQSEGRPKRKGFGRKMSSMLKGK
ncbi:hypothetical protein ACHAXT_002626 [Thalassiosira profunda]